ncbi:MAG: hypothetical protein JO142_08945 [Burkholderiales bacterium]|nr:hypothetical protein [Burkholderiales bacterium]
MNQTKKSYPTKLSVVDVGRWTLSPRAGLETLLQTGRIDIEAARMLLRLTELFRELGRLRAAYRLETKRIGNLLHAVEYGAAVNEDDINFALRWLDQAANMLRVCTRDEYRIALVRMVKTAELRVLLQAGRG